MKRMGNGNDLMRRELRRKGAESIRYEEKRKRAESIGNETEAI
jgi:hypothetical protein